MGPRIVYNLTGVGAAVPGEDVGVGKFGLDHECRVQRPEHHVLQTGHRVGEHIAGVDEAVLPVGEVGFGLHHVGVALDPESFLLADKLEGALGRLDLASINVDHLAVIEHVAVGFHRGEADVRLHLLLEGVAHREGSLAYLEVVDSLKSVEDGISGGDAVAVVERGRVDVGVGLRVYCAAEVVVGVGGGAYRRGEYREDGVAPCNLRIASGGLLDADLGRVGHGVFHTILEAHRRPSLRRGAQ